MLIGKAKLSHVDFGSPDKVEKMAMKAGCMQPGVGSFEDWPSQPNYLGVQLSLHCFMILNGYNCTTMTINSYKLGYGPPITMAIQLGQPWLYRYPTVIL